MEKGRYPAEQYYSTGRENRSVQSSSSIKNKLEVRSDKKEKLREKFIERMEYINSIRKFIEGPKVSEMSIDEFEEKIKEIMNSVPGYRSEELESKNKNIIDRMMTISDLKSRLGLNSAELSSYDIRSINEDLQEFYNRLNGEIKNPDDHLLACIDNFLISVFAKRKEMSSLSEDLSRCSNDIQRSSKVLYFLKNYHKFGAFGSKRKQSIIEDKYVPDLIKLLEEKINKGESVMDIVEIGNYEIIFNLDNGLVKDKKNTLGMSISSSSIIIIFNNDDKEKRKLVVNHEKKHNIADNPFFELGIHNNVYSNELSELISKLINDNFDYPKLKELRELIRGSIKGINGEIVADSESMIDIGYPKAFYFYMKDIINGLNKIIKTKEDELSADTSKSFLNKKIIEILIHEKEEVRKKAVNLFVKFSTYIHLAKENNLTDEFVSIVMIMPDSDKYLKRFFEAKLGRKIDINEEKKNVDVSVFNSVNDPVEPLVLKYFGPNASVNI